jgi:hypothetical protein
MAFKKPGKGGHRRPEGTVRLSQVVMTFGPGAMMDLLDHAVLIGGVDYWRYDKFKDQGFVDEPRLRDAIAKRIEPLGIELSINRAFRLPPDATDAVFSTLTSPRLAPGNYTVRLSDRDGGSGIGLIELYEEDDLSERLVNLSSRVFVGGGAAAAIAGFSIAGTASKRVLLRAAGPALAALGVAGVLANPKLEVRSGSGAVVAGNDDWGAPVAGGVSGPELALVASSVGAFPFSAGSRDAALVLTLAPGNYTAIVAGADGGSGVALVEIYEVP